MFFAVRSGRYNNRVRRRFLLIVLDGCGVGALPDAAMYGPEDPGSNTLGNTARAVGGLKLPHLQMLGLGNVAPIDGVPPRPDAPAWWGRLAEASRGKDTVTGHWEMMGVVTDPPFPTYPDGFPPGLLRDFERRIGQRTLGGSPASGTEILKALGEEHVRTGFPIVYTSADSVFQIAAHEEKYGLARLYRVGEIAREMLVPPHHVGRVIARPFVGESAATFCRTQNRRDWPLPPPHPTMLDRLDDAGKRVHLIGRTAELFPRRPGQTFAPTGSNPAHAAAVAQSLDTGEADFLFANFEDFDMLYGHRNDPVGFARALSEFDRWLGGELRPRLRPGDLVGLTADHGNDPTTPSTDHSREYVPRLLFGPPVDAPRALGEAPSFAWWGNMAWGWLRDGTLDGENQ